MLFKTLLEKKNNLSYGIIKQNIITKTLIISTGERKDNIKVIRKKKLKEIIKQFGSLDSALDSYMTYHIL